MLEFDEEEEEVVGVLDGWDWRESEREGEGEGEGEGEVEKEGVAKNAEEGVREGEGGVERLDDSDGMLGRGERREESREGEGKKEEEEEEEEDIDRKGCGGGESVCGLGDCNSRIWNKISLIFSIFFQLTSSPIRAGDAEEKSKGYFLSIFLSLSLSLSLSLPLSLARFLPLLLLSLLPSNTKVRSESVMPMYGIDATPDSFNGDPSFPFKAVRYDPKFLAEDVNCRSLSILGDPDTFLSINFSRDAFVSPLKKND
jgi:hypothetical protein